MAAWINRLIKLVYDARSWISGSAPPLDDFAALERDFVRKLAFPKFDWVVEAQFSPMNLPKKRLDDCRVALVSTAGVYAPGDRPFSTGLSGDNSYRVIPGGIEFSKLRVRHAGYDTKRVRKDLNAVFPLERLRELVSEGVVGEVAPRHFSFMGYAPKPEPLRTRFAPEVARMLLEDQVDLVLVAPV